MPSQFHPHQMFHFRLLAVPKDQVEVGAEGRLVFAILVVAPLFFLVRAEISLSLVVIGVSAAFHLLLQYTISLLKIFLEIICVSSRSHCRLESKKIRPQL